MLNPKENRLDYGDKLRPPAGFELSYAVASTFSVELETLLLLPVALAFESRELENKDQSATLATLEAVSHIKGRVKVFFQQGNIKIPHHFSRLYTLLEPCLVPVVPQGPFASFHPKIWLMRYTDTDSGKRVKYRLLVLSRNLTSSRSWDLAVALEGELGTAVTGRHAELTEFLADMEPYAKGFEGFAVFRKELPKVEWKIPPRFRELRFLPGSPERLPYDLGQGTDSLLVMSPFLHSEALRRLRAKCAGDAYLFSTAEELDRVGMESSKEWKCFALSERIVSGEESLDRSMTQNLHAKLIVAQNGRTAHWHIGSANATVAALGGDQSAQMPRNVEFMLRLTGGGEAVSLATLMRELVGTGEEITRIFLEHRFSEPVELAEPMEAQVRRQLVHQLINAKWRVSATLMPDGSYQSQVTSTPIVVPPAGFTIEVGQLAITHHAFRKFQGDLVWANMSMTQISAFLPVRVVRDTDSEVVVTLVIRAALDITGGDRRESAILQDLLNSEKKFMSYVAMLLHPDGNVEEALELESINGRGHGHDDWVQVLEGPILELLLRSASRQPQQLRRIQALMRRLERTDVPIPDEFKKVWKHFENYAGDRA